MQWCNYFIFVLFTLCLMLINLKLTLNENTCDTELCILSECNGNQTYIQLVPKETLNHLAKLAR